MTLILQDDHLTAGTWDACGDKHMFDYLTILAERGIDLDMMAESSRPQVSCQVSDCKIHIRW